jgi:hypothetical protein
MSYLNYEFLDEYKRLDNICMDIYGPNPNKTLGVTLYLEEMDRKASIYRYSITGWDSDYNKLKRIRNLRNELVHSRTSLSGYDICTEQDIYFIDSFCNRILNQTDPLALLRKKELETQERIKANKAARKSFPSKTIPQAQYPTQAIKTTPPASSNNINQSNKEPSDWGCLFNVFITFVVLFGILGIIGLIGFLIFSTITKLR